MKKILIALMLASTSAHAADTGFKMTYDGLDFSRIDHKAHFAYSYLIDLSLNNWMAHYKAKKTERLVVSAVITLGLGVGKEIMDSEFSMGDLKADILGVATASLFHYSFSF